MQHGHVIGQAAGLAEEVGGEHHGAALGGQLVDEGDDVAGAGGVEARGGLVEEEELGVVQQGPGQGDPLALSGGEAAGEVVASLGHAEPLEQLVDPPQGIGLAVAAQPGDVEQVLPGGQAVVEPGVLGEHAGAAADRVTFDGGVVAEHERAAAVGKQHPVEEPDGRGLAGAVGTEQGEHLPGLESEAETVDGQAGLEPAREPLGLDGGRHPVLLVFRPSVAIGRVIGSLLVVLERVEHDGGAGRVPGAEGLRWRRGRWWRRSRRGRGGCGPPEEPPEPPPEDPPRDPDGAR